MNCRLLLLGIIISIITACTPERVIEKPVVQTVVETRWREVPAELTKPCPKAEIVDEMTYGEAIEAWSRDRAAIDVCNGKLAGIESLGDDDGLGQD